MRRFQFMGFRVFELVTLGLALGFFENTAVASMPEKLYLDSLKAASATVARKHAASGPEASALSSAVIRSMLGRYYQIGDAWDVASWRFESTIMRMTSAPEHIQPQLVGGAIFHYQIVDVKTGATPQIILKVTQTNSLSSPDAKVPDPKVQALFLTMSDSMVQTQKAYQYAGSPAGTVVPVSADGLHSGMTVLELYPLDVPEIITANKTQPTQVPNLPPPAATVANEVKFAPNLANSSWFEQDDFFGRQVRILWEHGKPWPSYLETSGGISILVKTQFNQQGN